MSKKQTLLESFFERGERPNDETTEDSKTANKKEALTGGLLMCVVDTDMPLFLNTFIFYFGLCFFWKKTIFKDCALAQAQGYLENLLYIDSILLETMTTAAGNH